MGDYVNIKVPEYYYWEGQTPTLPDKDTSVKYKLVGPDSAVIDINPGFYIEKIDNYYSIRGNGKTRKLTLSFTKDTKITKEGTTTTAITNNDTTYTFNGKPTGKENQYYVSTGIITIKESTNQALMNEVKSGAKYMASSGEAYVQNTAAKSEFLQTDTIFSSSRTLQNLSKLVFFFFKDFVTLVLISVFIVTVIIILRAKAEFIYPHDLQSYPYVTPKYNQDVSVITPEPNFCDKTLTNVKMPDKVKNDEDIQVLEIFNKKMIDPDPQILEWRTEAFQNTCKHASNSTTGAFTILKYWMLYLVLNNYIYIQKTFSFLHNSLSFIPNDSFIMMIVFTILLFVLFYLVPNINIGIVQPYFHYNSGQEVKLNKDAFVDFTGEQGISGVIMSGLFSIISLFIVVFIPTYIILATTGVIGNISSLINILMTSSSVECMFLSFFSIISSINYILKLLPEDLDRFYFEYVSFDKNARVKNSKYHFGFY